MSSRPSQSGRILAIDLARIFAILFMIQGHTLHVLLAPAYRQGRFFDLWLYLRGLTAPVFLSLAGCSFFVVTMRMLAKSPSDMSNKVFKRIRRFTSFVCLGYLMHMPARSFWDLQYVDNAGLQSWYQVDVLQCIGVTLIAMQLLSLVARTPQRYAIACIAIGAAIVLSTPLAWSANWNHLPGFASAYLNGNSGSLFPLFPWAGYVFIGSSLGYLFVTQPSSATIRVSLVVAVIALFAGNVLQRMPWSLYGQIDYWKTSPNLFLIRWGAICLVVTAISAALRWFPIRSLPLAQRLASESLIAYIVHIAILYGTSWTIGLRQTMGESLNPLQTTMFIILMIVVSCAIAIGWNISKQKIPPLARAVFDPIFGRTPKSATAD
ncbi:MAG TPA: heparan-alpha-glucosaminide N-acetyltransferase domain-containing protein [Terriglobales bacterium]|nr:heparan-alpha-glucosaminide N-acetyltransferase domain-containing protein [Terriglobales bacterium]